VPPHAVVGLAIAAPLVTLAPDLAPVVFGYVPEWLAAYVPDRYR